MLVKVGDWKQGLLRFKRSGSWLIPEKVLTKINGAWQLVSGFEVVRLNQLSDILLNTTSWVYDTNRGWYRDTYDWGVAHNSKFTAEFLSKLRKVSVLVTGYYDSPAGSMSSNTLAIRLSDGNTVVLGTSDSWDYGPSGQVIYKGDAGSENMATRNVVGERFTYTVPQGVTVTAITLQSAGWYESSIGKYYPISLRGLKDFEFTLGY